MNKIVENYFKWKLKIGDLKANRGKTKKVDQKERKY